jgi:hypothetical protein
VIKKRKGQSAIPQDPARRAKLPAPPAGARPRPGAPHLLESREGAPVKTDKVPGLTAGQAGDRVKPPVPIEATKPPRKGAPVPLGEQQPGTDGGGEAVTAREQYIRMRVRVRDGRLSVIDSHLVDGPLTLTRSFAGSHAYEVTLDDQLLHAGDLPDLGVQRSFVNPDRKAPKEERGHHFTERAVFEFMARVPAGPVRADTIGRITLRLHRVKEEARFHHPTSAPLGERFEREMRPVAELVGLPESVLPDAIERRGARTPAL